MNGWNYVECKPINLVDPTGRIPEPNFGSEKGQYEYSCNCGWIDWTHVHSGWDLTDNIFKKIKGVQGRRDGPTAGTFIVSVPEHGDMFATITGNIQVSTALGDRTPVFYNVSLGIYIDLQDLLENYQSGNGPILYLPMINISGFSQEDLMSDLLGFYISHQEDNKAPHPDPKGSIRRMCEVVGLDEPDYQQKQMFIYIRHFPFTTNTEWFSPLVDCSVCEPDPGVLRNMFSDFSPVGPSPTGPWQWVSARICNQMGLHFCGSYDTDYLNNRWWQ
jgi:hypothetical protein